MSTAKLLAGFGARYEYRNDVYELTDHFYVDRDGDDDNWAMYSTAVNRSGKKIELKVIPPVDLACAIDAGDANLDDIDYSIAIVIN